MFEPYVGELLAVLLKPILDRIPSGVHAVLELSTHTFLAKFQVFLCQLYKKFSLGVNVKESSGDIIHHGYLTFVATCRHRRSYFEGF